MSKNAMEPVEFERMLKVLLNAPETLSLKDAMMLQNEMEDDQRYLRKKGELTPETDEHYELLIGLCLDVKDRLRKYRPGKDGVY